MAFLLPASSCLSTMLLGQSWHPPGSVLVTDSKHLEGKPVPYLSPVARSPWPTDLLLCWCDLNGVSDIFFYLFTDCVLVVLQSSSFFFFFAVIFVIILALCASFSWLVLMNVAQSWPSCSFLPQFKFITLTYIAARP